MVDVPLPRDNPFLIGQESAEKELLDSWNSGKFAHAWMLTGPRGIGKATLAYRFARFVLAGGGEKGLFGDQPQSLTIEPDHSVFRRITAEAHGDIRVVRRTINDKTKKLRAEIVVDDVREVGAFFSKTSTEGGWRVVIVDAADEMNRNAANALLKVLEEPPKQTILLLVCHAPSRLLPTIRSRCRSLALKPLEEESVSDLLERYRPDLDSGDRAVLARLSEGAVGRALELEELGGLGLYKDMVALLETLPGLDIPKLHSFGDKVAKGADAFRVTSQLFTWWLARMIGSGGRGIAMPEVLPGEGEVARRLLGTAALEQWVEVWEKVSNTFARTEAINLDRKQVLLNAFLAVGRLAGSR